tara:strand:- start:221 stop:385 length:165 start_codon:yes stop_codon:yes gene_type:complete
MRNRFITKKTAKVVLSNKQRSTKNVRVTGDLIQDDAKTQAIADVMAESGMCLFE